MSSGYNRIVISLRAIIAVFVLIYMTGLSYPVLAQIDHGWLEMNKESLLRLIDDEDEKITVIQPGTESFNLKAEEESRLMEKIWKRISEWMSNLNKWLERVFPSRTPSDAPEGVLNLNWLVAGIIAAILIFFFISIIPFLRVRATANRLSPEELDDSYISISMTQAIKRSEELASQNDYCGAMRELLKGFLMGLEEINRIPYRKSRTNREYQRLIRRQAKNYTDFASDFLPYMESLLYAGISAEASKYNFYRDALKHSFGK